ncbi:hypothetical protein ACF090_00895 [Streptomyces sp. NPDC014892]|uniref:hypothetical protein n=1 Tax=Streptomyces sp. NPDC014892 TaxID=3364930 RepID=UPI0037015B80
MDAVALITGLGGFALGLLSGGLSVRSTMRNARENPPVRLTVRRGETPGEYVLANSGFGSAYAVEVRLVAAARSTIAEVVTTEHWRQIQERSEVPFVVAVGEIARPPHEAVITWYAKERGGKRQTKTVQIQRGGRD